MFIGVIIILILGIVMFGPSLCAAIGTFYTTIVFFMLLVIMSPFVLIFNRSSMRRSDELYEQLKALEMNGGKYSNEYERLEKQFKESEAEVKQRTQSIFLIFLIISVTLFLIKVVQTTIGLY